MFYREYCVEQNIRENRTDYKEVAKFSTKCGEEWRSMTEGQKKKFRIMEECDRKRHLVEKRIFKNYSRNREHLKMPKKPKTALFFFRESLEPPAILPGVKVSPGLALKRAAERYKELTEKEKQKFLDLEKEDKERCRVERKIFSMRSRNKKAKKKVNSVPEYKITSKEFVIETDSD